MAPQSSQRPLTLLVLTGDAMLNATLDALLVDLPGHERQRVRSFAEALELRETGTLDCLLVDLAQISGDELAELTRSTADADAWSVIGLLRQDCLMRTTQALRTGVQDCVVIGDQTPARFARAVRHAVERQRVQQRLADLALRDELTGLYNRRGLLLLGEHQRRQCLRSGRSLVAAQVDVDGLKRINDTWGHQAGDQAIASTAAILRTTFRESDIVGRIGGDEFIALAVDARADSVQRVLKRLAFALANYNARKHTPYTLSFSVGASVLIPPAAPTLSELLERADHELYLAKRPVSPPPSVRVPVGSVAATPQPARIPVS
jgi:two-component system cell cycle response regulator